MTNEQQYIALAEKILLYGEHRNNQSGEPTISLFGEHLHLNLRDGFPLLTTKQMFFRSVKQELLWFLSGDSNVHALREHNVRIWDANADADGYVGPQYGAQWRHSGAPHTSGGFDQITNIIHLLRTRPTSRRMVLTAWSPHDVFDPANAAYQPPCHVLSQFYVNNDNTLTCQLYQRSGDLALGVPYNIASYALLTHLLAETCALTASNLLITFGDIHIYAAHIDDIRRQIQRVPLPPPTLRLTEIPDDKLLCINDASMFKTCDEETIGYVDAHIAQLRTKVNYLTGLRDEHLEKAQRLQHVVEQSEQVIRNMSAQPDPKQALLQKPCICDKEFRLVCAHCGSTSKGTPEFMHYRGEDGKWCVVECWGRGFRNKRPRLHKDYPYETLHEALEGNEHYV